MACPPTAPVGRRRSATDEGKCGEPIQFMLPGGSHARSCFGVSRGRSCRKRQLTLQCNAERPPSQRPFATTMRLLRAGHERDGTVIRAVVRSGRVHDRGTFHEDNFHDAVSDGRAPKERLQWYLLEEVFNILLRGPVP